MLGTAVQCRLSAAFAVLLSKSLRYESVVRNQAVKAGFQKTDISEFESSHPSHTIGLCRRYRPGMGYSVDSKSSLIEERAGKIARQQERLSVVALSLVLSRPSSSPENAVAVPDCADGSRRRALLTQARRSQLPWWRIAGLEQDSFVGSSMKLLWR